MIVDTDGVLKKVECKSSRYKDNEKSYQVALRTTGGNQSWNKVVKKIDAKKVDEIFILDGDGNYYIYNSKDLDGRRTVNVNNTLKSFRVISKRSLQKFKEQPSVVLFLFIDFN